MKRLALMGVLAAVALPVAGCGSAAKTGAAKATSAEGSLEEKLIACDSQLNAGLEWAKAGEEAVRSGTNQARVAFDQASYRLEQADKTLMARVPKTREAVGHMDSAIASARTATGEGDFSRVVGALSEFQASMKEVRASC